MVDFITRKLPTHLWSDAFILYQSKRALIESASNPEGLFARIVYVNLVLKPRTDTHRKVSAHARYIRRHNHSRTPTTRPSIPNLTHIHSPYHEYFQLRARGLTYSQIAMALGLTNASALNLRNQAVRFARRRTYVHD